MRLGRNKHRRTPTVLLPLKILNHTQGFTATHLLACAGHAAALNQLLNTTAAAVVDSGLPEALFE